MKKLMFSALACVAFAFSGFASNEVMSEEKVLEENMFLETIQFDERNYCDLVFITVTSDGELLITIKRGYGYNLNCDKEQAKIDAINKRNLTLSKGDFRDL